MLRFMSSCPPKPHDLRGFGEVTSSWDYNTHISLVSYPIDKFIASWNLVLGGSLLGILGYISLSRSLCFLPAISWAVFNLGSASLPWSQLTWTETSRNCETKSTFHQNCGHLENKRASQTHLECLHSLLIFY